METRRLSLFPLRQDEIASGGPWQYLELQEEASWAVSEVNLTDDVKEWMSLPLSFRDILKHLMAFFVVIDRLVNCNISKLKTMIGEDDIVRDMMLDSQARIEGVHQHMYGLFVETLITDDAEKARLRDAVKNFPSVARKCDWVQKHMVTDSLIHLVLANCFAEGLGFSVAFAIALYPKTMGLLKGWCFGNDKVMSDERLHAMHCADWYQSLGKLSDEEFYEMLESAVEVELGFVRDIIQQNTLPNLNSDLLQKYVYYLADMMCNFCGHQPYYKTVIKNPLPYMTLTSLKGKTNFFEMSVSAYGKLSSSSCTENVILDLSQQI